METETTKDATAGQAFYTKPLLTIYDSLMLGFDCRFVWKCPSAHMLELYNQRVSSNHLDIGVGTGYFPDRCKFPTADPRLVLTDFNRNSLEKSARRLERYHPQAYQWNILEPFQINIPSFDSVALMNLLHCLPGTIKTKGIVFEHVKALLNPGGVIFGSTILYPGVEHSFLAPYFLKVLNSLGAMTNKQDDLEGLRQSLDRHFSESSAKAIGYVALFWARGE